MRGPERGLSLLEVLAALAVVAIVLGLALPSWQRSLAMQDLRYGTERLATDLREAQERAKAERKPYTVTLTEGSSTYWMRRSGGGFDHKGEFPRGLVPTADVTVTFDAFGKPDATYTIQLRNRAGTGIVRVSRAGGIEVELP
ncbi:MAG: prepilin-type N-terminal cleavage/methylation domain-containing protein [Armatimonadota bacterium]|nr:prepilin-type N-terminal cleavage/methylation domain-containing protein [Armatimonadota bacterium]MDR7439418.1 prepilin-type N-terminal cleavage/methylation domain-containing protein [Armatimonadota bacterium]MDR7563059.1 prepilin-type N-terminal cleavage/methylation domain-containing protein [Armatimonadota bacterium]MDR7568127.1 prepilin-type N-terminal cleavage/methylation domain-containing protein [Armatimonadota bacterium]MDR7602892.1 prepilin-type N-terminal cleavage/methylation domain